MNCLESQENSLHHPLEQSRGSLEDGRVETSVGEGDAQ